MERVERLKNNHYIIREERNKFRSIYFYHVHDIHDLGHGKNVKKCKTHAMTWFEGVK